MTDLRQEWWKRDVESFERMKRLRDLAVKAGAKRTEDFANETLSEIEKRWPNHKVGER